MARLWFRFYAEALNDPKVQTLPCEEFKLWVSLLCLSCDADGILPSVSEMAWKTRLDYETFLKRFTLLQERGLMEDLGENQYTPHNWDARQFNSDTSTERVRKHRSKREIERNVSETLPKRCETVSVTVPDSDSYTDSDSKTETKTEKTPRANARPCAPFEEFWKAFPARNGRKNGKADALKVWLSLKVGEDLYQEIVSALAIQRKTTEWTKENGAFVPDAVVWLRHKRWMDEIVAPSERRPLRILEYEDPKAREPMYTYEIGGSAYTGTLSSLQATARERGVDFEKCQRL